MASCAVEKGILFWKKPCGGESLGNCRQCGRFACAMHSGRMGDGSMLCTACVERQDDSTGTIFTSGAIGMAAASVASAEPAAASAAADQVAPDSWHGSDSGSSSDSGGSSSDSGGSSSD